MEIFKFSLLLLLTLISPTTPGLMDDFTINLYRTVLRFNRDENLVISPSIIGSALGMVMHGAASETRNEIDYNLEMDNNELQAMYKQTDRTMIEAINKIFVSQKFALKQNYQQNVAQVFHSTAESLNFTDVSTAERAINAWVSEETHGKLKEMKLSIDNETQMLLVNAAQFHGHLLNKFQFGERSKKVFHLDVDDPTNADYLMLEDEFKYLDYYTKEVELLELPYQNTNMTMVILLPYEADGLPAIEEALTSNRLNRMLKRLEKQPVKVEIPKFKINTEVNLKVVFERMGIRRMFGAKAQFQNMVKSATDLKVTEVHHRCVFEVSVNGTVPIVETTTARPCINCEDRKKEMTSFIASRPFIFILRNEDFIFFIGRVIDPDFYKPLWYLDPASGKLLPHKQDV